MAEKTQGKPLNVFTVKETLHFKNVNNRLDKNNNLIFY